MTDPNDPLRYALAPNGVFWSIQGEAHLRGFQMTFVRLAGCSVGCPQCDTNYSVAARATAPEVVDLVRGVQPPGDRDGWVWITGGEPTDRDLRPLLGALKGAGYSTALATSGVNRMIPPVDWLSVSPHSSDPARFQQRYGNEVKLIDGLHGLDLEQWADQWDREIDFMYRYVQPISRRDATNTRWVESPESLARCLGFLRRHPRWALSRQDHHHWSVA